MRLLILLFGLLSCLCSSAVVHAQDQPVFQLRSAQDSVLAYTGQLDAGTPFSTLRWAWDSQNACFVETRRAQFTGNTVLYRTDIPKYSTMVIRLVPTDRKQEMSLLAYSGGHGALPPELSSCVSCEADFALDRAVVGRTRPAHVRSVELRAVNRPYPVTIAVVGADGLATGAYTLEVSLRRNR